MTISFFLSVRSAHEGNSIGLQDLLDLTAPAIQDAFHLLLERGVAAPHSHRYVVHEREEGFFGAGGDRRHLQLNGLPFGKITGERSPNDGDVDLARCHGVDDFPGRAVRRVQYRVPDNVASDSAAPEG